MVGDLRQRIAQLRFGVHPVQLGSADVRVEGGAMFAAAVGASEQVVAPRDADATQRALGCRIVEVALTRPAHQIHESNNVNTFIY
jgi:hypothetical protein